MSSLDNRYINTVKAIEAFTAFFDRIATFSENPDANKNKLKIFKEIVYNNVNDYDKIKNELDELLAEPTCSTAPSSQLKSENKSLGSITPTDPAKLIKPEIDTTYLSPVKNLDEKFITVQEFNKSPIQETLKEENNASNYFALITIDDMLGELRTKYLSQDDIFALSKLAGSYNCARVISDKFEAVYFALCCCFFEKFLKKKSKEGVYAFKQLLEAKPDNSSPEYNLFYSLLSQIVHNGNDDQLVINFYEILVQNKNYLSSLSYVFKEILNKYEHLRNRLSSFRWLNDLLESDKNAIQSFPNLLKCSLKIIVLENNMISTKIYQPDPFPDMGKKHIREVTLVYCKAENKVFLMNHHSQIPSIKPNLHMNSEMKSPHTIKLNPKKNLSLDGGSGKITTITTNHVSNKPILNPQKSENIKLGDIYSSEQRKMSGLVPIGGNTSNTAIMHSKSQTSLNNYNILERKGSDTDRTKKNGANDLFNTNESSRNSIDYIPERFKTVSDYADIENKSKEYYLDTSQDKYKTLPYKSSSRLYTSVENNKDFNTSSYEKSKLNISSRYLDANYSYNAGSYNTLPSQKTEASLTPHDQYTQLNPVLAKIMKNEGKIKHTN